VCPKFINLFPAIAKGTLRIFLIFKNAKYLVVNTVRFIGLEIYEYSGIIKAL